MTTEAERYSYSTQGESVSSSLPYLPMTLSYRQQQVSVSGLLDTGATINVLPYQIGIGLGAVWEEQTRPVQLTGNLAQQEARVLIVTGTVSHFPAVRLAFAWTRSDDIPLILGQVNFLMEFDVCFYRSQSAFEVKPKSQG